MARYETVTIYRNKKTGTYLIQPMARHPIGAEADFGEPARLSEAEFGSRIVEAVLENRKESGLVEITPSERVRTGYEGITESVITLHEDEIATRVAEALREAFKQVR